MRLSRDDRRIAFEIELRPGNARHASTPMERENARMSAERFLQRSLSVDPRLGDAQ